MKLFDVYPLFDIVPVSANGCYITDNYGVEYLDLYGGHAVISVGHSHPEYVRRITGQLQKIGFYSNSVQNPLQEELAWKLASFHTGKGRIISFEKSFHGRTSAAVAVTDNPDIISPLNDTVKRTILPLNDVANLELALQSGDVAAVIVEGIQGIGGCRVPEPHFLRAASDLCNRHKAVFILDEIQSGYGRSGKFFAHQYADIKPDIISVAKGMGNGFPIGGILISPMFKSWFGMLGTTFGGNYLSCAAGIAVLDIIKAEKLIDNSLEVGNYLLSELAHIHSIKELRGMGLMIGIEFDFPVARIRKQLLFEEKIFTGVSGNNIIRILPPLTLTKSQADQFVATLVKLMNKL
jgi:acetylornithine/N-succinyldiaminopimelate aminotransferase